MATVDHTAAARPFAPNGVTRPTNPLGRPFWTLSRAKGGDKFRSARITGLCMGIQAVTRILANSKAFRVLQESQASFDAQVTEGPFATLYMLSEQAVQTCSAMLEREGVNREGRP